MQSDNPMISDFVKLLNSAAGTFAGMGREARDGARERIKETLGGFDFVSRDEFEAVKTMAAKAREEVDSLKLRIAALEGAAGNGASGQKARAKPAGPTPGAGVTD